MLFFRKKKDEKLEQRKQEILHKIKPILSEILDVSQEKIISSTRLIEDLDADSLDSVEITMGLEETFNIEIPDEAAEKILTIDDVLNYLVQYADKHK